MAQKSPRPKIRSQPTASTDPTSDYARDVVSGAIIAGPHVRAACARHLRDLERGHERGLRFDAGKAKRALDFFPLVLRLGGDEYEGKPFVLQPWQVFIVGSIFGWVKADTGRRRFRKAYIETAKGSGKSPLVAGIGLYMMVASGQPRAEIYAAAAKRDQAAILFADAVSMVRQSDALLRRLTFSGGAGREWNIADLSTFSKFRTLSADSKQSGHRPYCGICDELHEHPTPDVIDMLEAGQKGLSEPLTVAITNSGADKTGVCWDWHQTSCDVAAGIKLDDVWFGYVCGMDDGDDPLHDSTCWPKANPSLQGSNLPTFEYLQNQVTKARNMPSAEAKIRRLNFCQWTDAETLFVGRDVWMRGQAEYKLEDFHGERCWAGLDLSSVRDLTALVLAFKRDGKLWTWPFFWLPAIGLAEKSERDGVPYTTYRDAGWLETTPGSGIDKAFVARRICELNRKFDIQCIAYDRHRIEDLLPFLDAEGESIKLEPHGQGYVGMAPAIDALETALVNGDYIHNGNPIMTVCASNTVVIADPAGNRKFDKARAIGRIDGMVAAAMGVRMATLEKDEPVYSSVYEQGEI